MARPAVSAHVLSRRRLRTQMSGTSYPIVRHQGPSRPGRCTRSSSGSYPVDREHAPIRQRRLTHSVEARFALVGAEVTQGAPKPTRVPREKPSSSFFYAAVRSDARAQLERSAMLATLIRDLSGRRGEPSLSLSLFLSRYTGKCHLVVMLLWQRVGPPKWRHYIRPSHRIYA